MRWRQAKKVLKGGYVAHQKIPVGFQFDRYYTPSPRTWYDRNGNVRKAKNHRGKLS